MLFVVSLSIFHHWQQLLSYRMIILIYEKSSKFDLSGFALSETTTWMAWSGMDTWQVVVCGRGFNLIRKRVNLIAGT